MAYKRRASKKMYRKKRSYRKKKTNWGNLAYKAFKTAKWVAGLVNAESKYYEATAIATASTYTGALIPLCYPAQGVGASQREGDSIKLKNLTIRGEFVFNGTNAENTRLIIFNDKENASTTAGDILEYTGSAVSVYSGKNPNLRFDTKILYDKTFTLDSSNPIRRFDIVLKCGWHTNFAAGTTTIENNSLKLLFIGQQAAAGATLSFIAKTTYIDN